MDQVVTCRGNDASGLGSILAVSGVQTYSDIKWQERTNHDKLCLIILKN